MYHTDVNQQKHGEIEDFLLSVFYHLLSSLPATLSLCNLDIVAQAFDALAVGIFRLQVP
jgi:hypothetical protein